MKTEKARESHCDTDYPMLKDRSYPDYSRCRLRETFSFHFSVVGVVAELPASIGLSRRNNEEKFLVQRRIEATTRLKNSLGLPSCHRHTITRSCSGSIQIVLFPAPCAPKLALDRPGHVMPSVLSHHK